MQYFFFKFCGRAICVARRFIMPFLCMTSHVVDSPSKIVLYCWRWPQRHPLTATYVTFCRLAWILRVPCATIRPLIIKRYFLSLSMRLVHFLHAFHSDLADPSISPLCGIACLHNHKKKENRLRCRPNNDILRHMKLCGPTQKVLGSAAWKCRCQLGRIVCTS